LFPCQSFLVLSMPMRPARESRCGAKRHISMLISRYSRLIVFLLY